MVVGAERMGDSDGFDSLLRESSSSTSSSSTGVAWVSSPLPSSTDGEDSLEMGDSWLCNLSAPRILPQPFVKLLFSFTCGFDRMQPLKSNGSGSQVSSDVAAVAGGELHFAVLIPVSEVSLYATSNAKSGH